MRWLALLCFWIPTGAVAGAVDAGAADWDNADLPSAMKKWEAPLESNRGSGILYYNLGNAWYARGDLPRAIASWRTARRIRPRDPSLVHNLAIARSELEGDPPIPVGSPAPWLQVATIGELGVLASIFLLIGGIGGWIRRMRGRGTWTPWAVCGSSGALLGVAALVGDFQLNAHPVGVVVDHPAQLRDLAAPNAQKRHLLPLGSEISVLREVGDFWLVSDYEGRQGWAPRGGIELIDPLR